LHEVKVKAKTAKYITGNFKFFIGFGFMLIIEWLRYLKKLYESQTSNSNSVKREHWLLSKVPLLYSYKFIQLLKIKFKQISTCYWQVSIILRILGATMEHNCSIFKWTKIIKRNYSSFS